MDVECAESQTSRMSRMLLTHSLRLNTMIRESNYKDMIPFDIINKIRVILGDVYINAQELGGITRIQSVALEHIHFFFTVLHMNVHNIQVSFLPDLYYVFKLKLLPRSSVDSSLDSVKFMYETLGLLFPAGFADPNEDDEPHLKTKRSEIRILIKKVQTLIPILQELFNRIRDFDEMSIHFVTEMQEYSNPVASCLVNSPSTTCAICRRQQLTEEVDFAVVACCLQLFCLPCLKKHLRTKGKCPACRERIDVTVSSSYMKRPAFKAGLPEKYDLVFHRRGHIGRLW